MSKKESLEEFYRQKIQWMPENLQKDIGHFNVFRQEDCLGPGKTPVQYSRRDFYKISLVRGHLLYHYADKTLETTVPTLLFFNPEVPYTFEMLSEEATGYFCIFREAFFIEHFRGHLRELPMYAPGGRPAYPLDAATDKAISQIFEKMLSEIQSEYTYKYDLLRNYVTELTHSALKLRPSESLYQQVDANARITSVFTELLERQFPIESPSQRLTVRSASDYANQLAVHVNHLNRAIRLTTGRTTTEHIAERIANEAMALLKHTSWNISEISYCLGFEDPAHFNHFFKKHTRQTPSAFRH